MNNTKKNPDLQLYTFNASKKQIDRLRKASKKTNRSIAEIIRSSIEAYLQKENNGN